jgi:hypothetical protein
MAEAAKAFVHSFIHKLSDENVRANYCFYGSKIHFPMKRCAKYKIGIKVLFFKLFRIFYWRKIANKSLVKSRNKG